MEQRPVAVFDLDGTLFRSSLTIELVKELIVQDIFPKETEAVYMEAYENWIDRRGSYRDYIESLVEALHGQLKGKPYALVANCAGEVIEKQRARLYCYTRDLLKTLKAKGYFLLAISHSPKFIVDGFAYELGFDKSYGLFYTTGPSDQFTGEIEDLELMLNKSAILQRAMRKDDLTLKSSVVVGDTETDISMLEMAETPIAFNPNQELYNHAKRRGWNIIVERKDVIYEIA